NNAEIDAPTFTPVSDQQQYQYLFTVTSTQGCEFSDSLDILVLTDVMVPSGFSPNDDGFNDEWEISVARILPVTVEVFNRWGERVFYSEQYDTKWDGTFKGKPLPVGTYYFVIKVKVKGKEQVYTGPITIVR
ncbi:MAG: gliding motility-associated C-terminal domain-containing protein, partial [bacterium]